MQSSMFFCQVYKMQNLIIVFFFEGDISDILE